MTVTEPTVQVATLALIDLVDCVCAELATTGAGPVCWCGAYPGAQVSWDYCGECSGDVCGMGYVRLAGAFPYETFPVPMVDERCHRPLAWAVEVGALRCLPQPADGGLLAPAAMSEVAISQALDAEALWRAIKCCGLGLAVQAWNPIGPQGGCVGGFWMAFVPSI